MRPFIKDPQAVLDYSTDWSTWLAVGETITAATVTVPTGLTKDSQTNTGTVVTAWLSGGAVGLTYTVVYHITSSLGRQDERSISIAVRDR